MESPVTGGGGTHALLGPDSSGMLPAALSFPRQLLEGLELAGSSLRGADLRLSRPDPLRGLAVAGMGGSGVVGDALAGLAWWRGRVPVAVVKDYSPPWWVGAGWAAIACSYSGETEETLAVVEELSKRGMRPVVVASGGRLLEMAEVWGWPGVRVPGGYQPRSALGYLLASVLVAAEELGAFEGVEELGARARDLARLEGAWGPEARGRGPEGGSRVEVGAATHPLDLALWLQGALPVVWGASPELAAAAGRWRTQLNENAKVLAIAGALPEADHNEVVPLGEGVGEGVRVVVLEPAEVPPAMARRLEATAEEIAPAGAVLRLAFAGTPLARFLTACYLGDLTSVYLALLRGVDPTPVPPITRLKARLAGASGGRA